MEHKRPGQDAQAQRSDYATLPSNLGLLGARAAVVLDQRARGEAAPIDAVRAFGSALIGVLLLDRSREPGAVEPTPESRAMHRLWPLNTAALFQKALISDQGSTVHSLDELMSVARLTASQLAEANESLSTTKSAELRDVCLAVSRAAQAQHAQARTPIAPRNSR